MRGLPGQDTKEKEKKDLPSRQNSSDGLFFGRAYHTVAVLLRDRPNFAGTARRLSRGNPVERGTIDDEMKAGKKRKK